jgi:hypothetical protein
MLVHEIKADTTELLNNSARIEATVQDTNLRVAQMEGKINDLHSLMMQGGVKEETLHRWLYRPA